MSREVRRVPLDFDWPMHKVWGGYVMPAELVGDPCPDCSNGSTPARAWVEEIAHLLLMLDDDIGAQQRGQSLHPYFQSVPTPLSNGEWDQRKPLRPSADIRDLGTGLAGRQSSFMGHDACDRWATTDKIIEAAGLSKGWGICQTCDGTAAVESYPGQAADAEAWKSTDPPMGDGWQYWETVSEGSPISPVFATGEELSVWLQTDYRPVGGGRLTKAQADTMIERGWAPSFIGDGTGLHAGDGS